MSLKIYKSKRNFRSTTEPKPTKISAKKTLRFVVQKHAASHLHYDFRLELKGVLLSWAVPKGPSLNPKEKRLAVHVEDHPIAYADFEGTIPRGEYGGGAVVVWDTGTWEPLGDSNFKKGVLKFLLKGKKLKGMWSLVRLKDRENWLLIKDRDRYASEKDVLLKKPESVKSKKTLAKLLKTLDGVP